MSIKHIRDLLNDLYLFHIFIEIWKTIRFTKITRRAFLEYKESKIITTNVTIIIILYYLQGKQIFHYKITIVM